MANNDNNEFEELNEDVTLYSGVSPILNSTESYSSADGTKIYLQFSDADSSGLSPSSGLQLRFRLTKITGGSATTVTPISTFIDPAAPKTLILNLNSPDKVVDALYDGSGVATTYQNLFVTYNTSSFGSTVPLLSDNDSIKSYVESFTGTGISNRTQEANGPVVLYATSSTLGNKIEVYFREATPPLFPYSSITGFAVTQNSNGINITAAYVKDTASATNGKVVVLDLADIIEIDSGSNPVTLSYQRPLLTSSILKDSTAVGNLAIEFAGLAVTNLSADQVKPTLLQAITNTGSTGNTVYVSMSKVTLPSTPSGFGLSVNGIGVTFALSGSAGTIDSGTNIGRYVTTYSLTPYSTFNPESLIYISYNKPVTNFIYDTTVNANTLDTFAQSLVSNELTDDVAPTLDQTNSYVDTSGYNLYLKFNENRSKPLLPDTGIEGFKVLVNGQNTLIKSAESLNNSDTDNEVLIKLYNKVYNGDIVKVAYFPYSPETSVNLRDSNDNYVETFEPESITNNSYYNTSTKFDILDWNNKLNTDSNFDFTISTDTTDLLRKFEKYPSASVILDTRPPVGYAILNRNADLSDPGIKIHDFSAYGNVNEETGSNVDFTAPYSRFGWKFYNTSSQAVKSITFRFKKLGTIYNSGDKVNVYIYANDPASSVPTTAVKYLGSFAFSILTNSYQNISIDTTDLTLDAETYYWFEFALDNMPISSDVNPVGIIASTHTKTGGSLVYFNNGYFQISGRSGYYKIVSVNNDLDPLASIDLLYDIFDSPVREANSLGGSVDLTKYEVIGSRITNSIVKKLDRVYIDPNDSANDIYPTVVSLRIGATSSRPKNYLVEIKTNPNNEWEKVFDTISDENTLDYLVYTFESPTQMSDIRVTHKGDYFTIDETASLTIAAYDDLSQVVSAQISHFSDFRDAAQFENADVKGFISFEDGETEFTNFPIADLSRVWLESTGGASSDVQKSISFNSKIILAANNKIFVYSGDTVSSITNDLIVVSEEQITAFAIYKNKAYLGTTNGEIYTSLNGEFWTLVNFYDPLSKTTIKSINPIKTLDSLGDKLYIGTTKGNTSSASIYTYDGRSILKVKDLSFNEVTSSAVHNNSIYFGVSDGYGSSNSAIYTYNNVEWVQTLSAQLDSVDSMVYSTTRDSIVAGFRGGEIWELPFLNNLPKSWSKIFDLNGDRILSISDDSYGNYLFLNTDVQSYGYFKSLETTKPISSINYLTNNLSAVWRKYTTYALSYSEDITDFESYSKIVSTVQADSLNYSDFSTQVPDGFTYTNLTLEGGLSITNTGAYSFKVITNMGIKLYIDDELVIDEYTAQVSDQSYLSTKTFTYTSGEFARIKILAFVSSGTTPSFKLYWNNTNDILGYEIINSNQYYRNNKINSILQVGTKYYGTGSDGKVYEFDPTFYSSRTRNVYVRLKDEAGNIQGIVLPAHTTPFPLITDKIQQDINTLDNVYQPNGKIYQITKKSDKSLTTRVVYTPKARQYSIYAPDRNMRASGVYEGEPFYVPTLVKWGQFTSLIINKYGLNTQNGNTIQGLDAGTEVRIYIKSGSTRTACLNASWGTAYKISYINNDTTIPPVETYNVDIQNINDKWIQFKYELITATKNLTPEIVSATITYTAGTGSYYFTKIFNTSDFTSDSSSPKIRRGLLTSNEYANGGTISYGYTTSTADIDIYDFNKFTPITPNHVFELANTSGTIKFGILFTAVGETPSVVTDFAVQLDMGGTDLKMMPSL